MSAGAVRVSGLPLSLDGNDAADVSLPNEGRLRYDTATQQFLRSYNTGPYLPFGGAGTGVIVVATTAALTAYDDTGLTDATPAWMTSLYCEWMLVRTSTAVVDNITICATHTGVGRWHRRDSFRSPWAYETTWYLDFHAGDDENVGTDALHPLQTNDELVRRIGKSLGIAGPLLIDVYILEGLTEGYLWYIDWTGAECSQPTTITYHGERQVLHSGSVTFVDIWNPAGTVGLMKDAALPPAGFAPYIHRAFVITSGPKTGFVGWLEEDAGDQSAYYQMPTDTVATLWGNPAVGETYDILELATLDQYVTFDGPSCLTFAMVDVRIGGTVTVQGECSAWFGSCLIEGIGGLYVTESAAAHFNACRFSFLMASATTEGNAVMTIAGNAIECDLIANSRGQPDGQGSIKIETPTSTWGQATMGFAASGNIWIETGTWWAVLGMPAGSWGIKVSDGAIATLGGLFWGFTNLTSYGLYVTAGSCVRYGTLPTFGPNSTADCLIGTATSSYATLPAVSPIDMCGVVNYV
jgi:hypothetical protein